MSVVAHLEGQDGFFTGFAFSDDELLRLRQIIHGQWIRTIESKIGPAGATEFERVGMTGYHEKADLLDHQKSWPKVSRVLDAADVLEIRKMSLFMALEKEFGKFELSDEEDFGRELIYWRLVRPGAADDVGPLHADAWFWELGHGTTPAGYQRVKVWISIYLQEAVTGFIFVPGSHRTSTPYKAVTRHGMTKPQIGVDPATLGAVPFRGKAGDAIVFHDKLLHGGEVGAGSTRVSLEFTIFVKNENYFGRVNTASAIASPSPTSGTPPQ